MENLVPPPAPGITHPTKIEYLSNHVITDITLAKSYPNEGILEKFKNVNSQLSDIYIPVIIAKPYCEGSTLLFPFQPPTTTLFDFIHNPDNMKLLFDSPKDFGLKKPKQSFRVSDYFKSMIMKLMEFVRVVITNDLSIDFNLENLYISSNENDHFPILAIADDVMDSVGDVGKCCKSLAELISRICFESVEAFPVQKDPTLGDILAQLCRVQNLSDLEVMSWSANFWNSTSLMAYLQDSRDIYQVNKSAFQVRRIMWIQKFQKCSELKEWIKHYELSENTRPKAETETNEVRDFKVEYMPQNMQGCFRFMANSLIHLRQIKQCFTEPNKESMFPVDGVELINAFEYAFPEMRKYVNQSKMEIRDAINSGNLG